MPPFSLSDLHIPSSLIYASLCFFPSTRESKLCATSLTSSSSHPSVFPPPRLVFQPVSLFNRLIPPSLIKHDHRPCEALRSSILRGSLSPISGFSQLQVPFSSLSPHFTSRRSVFSTPSSVPLRWSLLTAVNNLSGLYPPRRQSQWIDEQIEMNK